MTRFFVLLVVFLSAQPASAQFTYAAPGDLEGTEPGRVDMRVYAPGMRFPIRDAPAYANSQIYGHGGYMGPGGGECHAANRSYPWHDNYCETRSWSMPLCPTGMGHQGQDIRAATCAGGVHPAVAAVDGTITNIGSYSVYLTASDGTRYDYLHMSGLTVSVGDTVRRGDVIGYVDNEFGGTATTYHLHFNIRQAVSGVGTVYVPPYMSLVRAYEELLGGEPPPPPPPPPPGPALAAEYVHQTFPLSSDPFPLSPGASFTGYIELRNRGRATWSPGATLLRTTEPRGGPSPLVGPDWASPSEPATVDRVVPPGATGRFVFTVVAPTTAGEYSQYFGLEQVGIGWFGDDGGPVDRWIEVRVMVAVSSEPDLDADGSPSSRDCDDARADVYPGAPEACGDGVDQNCDGADATCTSETDTGVRRDTGVDAGPRDPGRDPSGLAAGCGCRAATAAHPPLTVLVAGLGVVALRRRRAGATAP